MSTLTAAPTTLSPEPSQSRSRAAGDDRAPYDDLIDQYATSYTAHHTDPPPFDDGHSDRDPPLYPLSQHQSNYSEISFKDVKGLEEHTTQRLDWEYPPPKTMPDTKVEKESRTSCWEIVRAAFIPDSIACRLYLLTITVETAIDLAIEAELFVRLQDVQSTSASSGDDPESRKMPVYLSIFAMAHLFQFAMALDAVYNRNTLQFIALTIFNALFLVYAIIQIGEIGSPSSSSGIPIHVLTTVIPIVISVAELAYIGLGWKIYNEFGWKVYKYLGADRRIKSMYAYYQIFLCLVKFDLFFWCGFSVQFIWLVLSEHNAEYYLTCLAFPLSILVLVVGHFAARHEKKWAMFAFMTGCAGAMVYFMYKLVEVVRRHGTATFVDVWKSLTIFSVFAIVLLLTTFVFACMVTNNFGRGLKNQMAKNQNMARRGKSQDIYRGPMSTHPNRMSIE